MEELCCPHSSVFPPPQTTVAGDRTMTSLCSSVFPRSLSCSDRKMASIRIISFQWPEYVEGDSWDIVTFIVFPSMGLLNTQLKRGISSCFYLDIDSNVIWRRLLPSVSLAIFFFLFLVKGPRLQGRYA